MSYTECFEGWIGISADNQWQTYNVTENHSIPPSAVLEVLCINKGDFWDEKRNIGLRSTASSGQADGFRRIELAESIDDLGDTNLTIHVQLDSSGYLQYFVEDYLDINFTILGYWLGCEYTDAFDEFDPSAPSGWENYALDQYGVGSGQIAEIVMSNTAVDTDHTLGVRSSGSAIDRRFGIKQAEGGGEICLGVLVPSSGVTAGIDIWSSDTTNCSFRLVGYFSVPPAKYNETYIAFHKPGSQSSWVELDVGASGIPSNIVAQFGIQQEFADDITVGIRETNSNISNRRLDLDKGGSTSPSWGSIHSNIDDDGKLEYYCNDISDEPLYEMIGYWDNFASATFSKNDNVDLLIEGMPEIATGSGVLYTTAHEFILDESTLFIHGRDFIDSSGQYPSGVTLCIYGIQLANFDLYIYSKDHLEISGDLYIFGANISTTGLSCYTQGSGIIPENDQFNLIINGIDEYQASGNLFISAYENIVESGNLFLYGYDVIQISDDLFIHGQNNIEASGNLFITGPISYSGNMYMYIRAGCFEPPLDLFIQGHTDYSGVISEFIKGPEFICSSGSFSYPYDIEDFIYPYGDPSPTLYIQAHEPISGICPLYIGPLRDWGNWTFYLKTEDNDINDTVNLFIHGFSGESGVNQTFNNAQLYLEAADADYPYTAGGTEAWTMFLKVQSGNLISDDVWTMFLKADFTIPATCNLYTYGHASGEAPHGVEISGSVNFICSVNPDDLTRIGYTPFNSDTDPWTLFLKCEPGHFDTVNLYMSGVAPINYSSSGNLFIEGLFEQETNTVSLYLMGISGMINNGPSGLHLFLNADILVYNTSGNLYTHGY